MNRMIRKIALAVLAVTVSTGWKGDGRMGPDPVTATLRVPEGFRVERLHSPRMAGQGSWVSMTFDDKGRILASDQHGFHRGRHDRGESAFGTHRAPPAR
ncbi:MAG: hypothetical protein EBZ67_12960 [Chitinophagia bacterium]|nr:hypothetical protein [Chitinophagia bacterium]